MWLMTLLACRPTTAPVEAPPFTGGSEAVSVSIFEGPVKGDGFGSSLASGPQLLVGAPGTEFGRLYEINSGGIALLYEESTPGAGGSAVAWSNAGHALMGSPLAGEGQGRVYSDGEVFKEGGKVLGGQILAEEDTLLISESAAIWVDEQKIALPHRVGGLAIWEGSPVAGHPFGELALSGPAHSLPRAEAYDQAGYAICSANLDEDPEDELVIGAPSAGKIYVLNAGETLEEGQTLSLGEGRFGHALACRDHLIAIGAPTYGTDLSGAVWCLAGDHSDWALEEPVLVGSPWQQLGFSLAMGPRELAAGGPGSADVPGIVQRARW